ncbi:MAG: SMEK domain-containing protein [Clostridium butyricum]|nr:SMEK domain-containing protein [Clostridium butyricum]
MIKKQKYIDKIDTYFAQIIAYIILKNKKDQFDINKFCEDLFCELLNKIYGFQLENLNRTKGKNYPAVDLGDYSSRVSYQVTSTHKSNKIKDTLEKVEKYELYKEFDDVYILMLGKKGEYKSKQLTEAKYKFKFTIEKNIVDIYDLSTYISENKSINEMKIICNYLEDNIGIYEINNKKNKKIKIKDKLELTDEQMKKVLKKCKSKLDSDVSDNDIKEVLKKIRKCNELEKSIVSNILDEYKEEDYINLSDLFNEYEDLDINEYIISIKNLMEKEFIDDRRNYTYIDPVEYSDDEIEKTGIRIGSGIWRLGTQGEILMILKNVIGNKLLIG